MIVVALSRWLILATAGDAEAEFVVGDLDEEFELIAGSRGRRAAAWWLASQAIRSASPLVALRIRSGEMTHAVVAGFAGAALPLYGAEALWRFVHSHIPYKNSLERDPWQLAMNLVLLCCCAFFAGDSARTRRRAASIAISIFCMTAAGIAASRGAVPAAYAMLALVGAPAAALATNLWRKSE